MRRKISCSVRQFWSSMPLEFFGREVFHAVSLAKFSRQWSERDTLFRLSKASHRHRVGLLRQASDDSMPLMGRGVVVGDSREGGCRPCSPIVYLINHKSGRVEGFVSLDFVQDPRTFVRRSEVQPSADFGKSCRAHSAPSTIALNSTEAFYVRT
jgi:hypothetical protein